jgi:hypothetical protein
MTARANGISATCVGCGCTDDHACRGGCAWLRVDYEEGIGVCSNCAEYEAALGHRTRARHPITQGRTRMSALAIPKLAKGEVYVGAIVGPDGKGEHVILLAGDKDMLTWSDAMKWAKKQGGDLPNRVEQALLFAHHPALRGARYWSNTQTPTTRWAWCQTSTTATRLLRKGSKLRARAVRRVPIR